MATFLTSVSRLAAPREPLEGTDIADAREALEYWTRREARLPWHRRAARRECRQMIAAWRATLVGAHLERWRLGRMQEVVLPLFDVGGRTVRRRAWIWMRRSSVGRVLLAVAFAGAAMATATIALLVLLVALLLGN